MARGDKPAISISLKPVGGAKEDRVYFMAGWPRDDGKVSSLQLDRKIKAMKVQLEDGKVVTITRGADGKWSHYIDVFTADAPSSTSRPAPKPASVDSSGGEFGEDFGGDFGDDSIPFAPLRGEWR